MQATLSIKYPDDFQVLPNHQNPRNWSNTLHVASPMAVRWKTIDAGSGGQHGEVAIASLLWYIFHDDEFAVTLFHPIPNDSPRQASH